MAAGKDGNDDLLDDIVLANNRLTHFFGHAAVSAGEFLSKLLVTRAGQ